MENETLTNEEIQLAELEDDELVVDMEKKNAEIDEMIDSIASRTLGITSEQIVKAKEMYHDDPRSLDEIKEELEELSRQITEETRRREEIEERMREFSAEDRIGEIVHANESEVATEAPIIETSGDEGYYKTEILDLSDLEGYVGQVESGPDEPVMTEYNGASDDFGGLGLAIPVSIPEPQMPEPDELTNMLGDSNVPGLDALPGLENVTGDMVAEKGKMLVKTPEASNISNEGGFSSAMNLSFMLSTVSILGLFIASMLILLSRIFA